MRCERGIHIDPYLTDLKDFLKPSNISTIKYTIEIERRNAAGKLHRCLDIESQSARLSALSMCARRRNTSEQIEVLCEEVAINAIWLICATPRFDKSYLGVSYSTAASAASKMTRRLRNPRVVQAAYTIPNNIQAIPNT